MKTSYPSYPIAHNSSKINSSQQVTLLKNILPYLTLSYPICWVTWVTWVTSSYPILALAITGLGKKVTFLYKIIQKQKYFLLILFIYISLTSCKTMYTSQQLKQIKQTDSIANHQKNDFNREILEDIEEKQNSNEYDAF